MPLLRLPPPRLRLLLRKSLLPLSLSLKRRLLSHLPLNKKLPNKRHQSRRLLKARRSTPRRLLRLPDLLLDKPLQTARMLSSSKTLMILAPTSLAIVNSTEANVTQMTASPRSIPLSRT